MKISQKILSIDITTHVAQIVISEVNGWECRILESHVTPFDLPELLVEEEISAENIEAENDIERLTEDLRKFSFYPDHPRFIAMKEELGAILKECINSWDYSILVCSPDPTLYLNLSFPFAKDQEIEKVILSEVSDKLPFEINNFLLQYSRVGKTADDEYEVLVRLVPKKIVGFIIDLLRELGVEIANITTPPSIYSLYFPEYTYDSVATAICVGIKDTTVSLSLFVKSGWRIERVFKDVNNIKSISSEIQRIALYSKTHYQQDIDIVHIISDRVASANILANSLPFKVEIFESNIAPNLLFTAKSSLIAQESPPLVPATSSASNFRTADFKVNPQAIHFITATKSLIPYIGLGLLAIFISFFMFYGFRKYEISSYQQTISQLVKQSVPEVSNVASGTELPALRGIIRQLHTKVETLKSFASTNPLDILGIVSRFFPAENGISIEMLKIENGSITIRGKAPNFDSVDKIKKSLRKQKRYFCKIRKSPIQRNSKDNITFEYSFDICSNE
jgi:hypothetical protein